MKRFQILLVLVAVIGVLLLTGCQMLVSRVTSDLAESLSKSIMNSEDLRVVEDGLPAYLILIDALLLQNGSSVELLLVASQINGSYAAAFVSEPERRKHMAAKSRELAFMAACLKEKSLCELESKPFEDFEMTLDQITDTNVTVIYGLASAWAGWLHAHSDDMQAIVQLPRVKLLIEKMLQLDETYDNGAPHMYMGVFASLTPPSLGGRPEVARKHFLKAIEISNSQNLYAKVLYAQNYARMMYDRELHDALLDEVLEADPRVEGSTLQNKIAQEMALELKRNAEEYF